MTLGEQIRLKRKQLGLSAEALSVILSISKDKIYKWETGTKPGNVEDFIKVQSWLSGELENVPREVDELEIKEPAAAYTNYREKYIALLEKENEKKDRIIDVSLIELMTGQRISQAHLKTLLQITVTETAVMQGKDPVEALKKASITVASNYESTLPKDNG